MQDGSQIHFYFSRDQSLFLISVQFFLTMLNSKEKYEFLSRQQLKWQADIQ